MIIVNWVKLSSEIENPRTLFFFTLYRRKCFKPFFVCLRMKNKVTGAIDLCTTQNVNVTLLNSKFKNSFITCSAVLLFV